MFIAAGASPVGSERDTEAGAGDADGASAQTARRAIGDGEARRHGAVEGFEPPSDGAPGESWRSVVGARSEATGGVRKGTQKQWVAEESGEGRGAD